MTKKPIDWVTMGPAPHFATCQRCGGHVNPPVMPMSIKAFVTYSDYALELHRHCKSEAEKPEVTELARVG